MENIIQETVETSDSYSIIVDSVPDMFVDPIHVEDPIPDMFVDSGYDDDWFPD